MRIPLGPFEPDRAELDSGGVPYAINVYPAGDSKKPLPSSSAFTDALASEPRGLWLANTNAGDFVVYAAVETALYRLGGTSWTSIGTGLTGPGTELWAGVQFGTDFFFNNVNDGLQIFDIEAGSAISAVGGSSPNARYMDVVEEYLVCANTDNSPREIVWSDTNNGETWGSGNSGSQTFPDGGAITAICGAAGLVIQEQIIRRMVPDPGGDIFIFEKLEQAKGSIAPHSVIRFGEAIGYLAEDGFWFNGNPIGQGRVNTYFLSSVDQDQLSTVLGVADPIRPLFWWYYRSNNASSAYDRALIYNWRTDEWGEAVISIHIAAQSATAGYTLETLSDVYTDLDAIPYSFDSRVFLGGRPVHAVIDTDYKLGFLEGTYLEATVDTAERELIQSFRTSIGGVRPIVDNANAVINVRTRDRLGDAGSWGAAEISQQTSGICPVRRAGRFHRVRVRIPAGETWTDLRGVEIPDALITRLGLR